MPGVSTINFIIKLYHDWAIYELNLLAPFCAFASEGLAVALGFGMV
jgi:hypothetical protein